MEQIIELFNSQTQANVDLAFSLLEGLGYDIDLAFKLYLQNAQPTISQIDNTLPFYYTIKLIVPLCNTVSSRSGSNYKYTIVRPYCDRILRERVEEDFFDGLFVQYTKHLD